MELRVLIANGLILAMVALGVAIPVGLWFRAWRARRRRQRRRRFDHDRPYFSNESMPRSPMPPAKPLKPAPDDASDTTGR